MTFHARLLVTILAVVIVTTVAALYIAQRQNSASYRAVVDELLRSQTLTFQREQERRHEIAVQQAARLAASVRLFAALEANDPEVYKIASDELRLGEFEFFRLLNRRGQVIPPPADGRAGAADLRAPEASIVPKSMPRRSGEVELGFIEAGNNGSASRIYRVLAAPISSFGSHVGTLILGQQVMGFTERPGDSDISLGLRSALRIDDRLVGGDIPSGIRGALAQVLDARPAEADGQFRANDTAYRYQRSLLNENATYPPAYLISTFSMASFEAQQNALMLRIALTGLVASLVAGLLALELSRKLARPIGRLVSATREIRAGNYAHRLGPSSTREMNTLADSFNEMAADLALKDRYHSMLQQAADPQVAEELISGRVKLGGELRDVTVMFCDIRQYTQLTVGRDPEAVIELLNHHMSAMTRVVQDHRGVINQFAGDAIMALFGAPKSYGDDTGRAVRCACAMMLERERLNAEAEIPMRIGIGIASGLMVAGCIGAENRSDYTVVGERVNLAARLASSAAAGEILVDEITRERVSTLITTAPLKPLSLKGFAEPVAAHRIRLDRSAAA
jgi:class 3 adenylate cyclase